MRMTKQAWCSRIRSQRTIILQARKASTLPCSSWRSRAAGRSGSTKIITSPSYRPTGSCSRRTMKKLRGKTLWKPAHPRRRKERKAPWKRSGSKRRQSSPELLTSRKDSLDQHLLIRIVKRNNSGRKPLIDLATANDFCTMTIGRQILVIVSTFQTSKTS